VPRQSRRFEGWRRDHGGSAKDSARHPGPLHSCRSRLATMHAATASISLGSLLFRLTVCFDTVVPASPRDTSKYTPPAMNYASRTYLGLYIPVGDLHAVLEL
jgi:hypothetical protein